MDISTGGQTWHLHECWGFSLSSARLCSKLFLLTTLHVHFSSHHFGWNTQTYYSVYCQWASSQTTSYVLPPSLYLTFDWNLYNYNQLLRPFTWELSKEPLQMRWVYGNICHSVKDRILCYYKHWRQNELHTFKGNSFIFYNYSFWNITFNLLIIPSLSTKGHWDTLHSQFCFITASLS